MCEEHKKKCSFNSIKFDKKLKKNRQKREFSSSVNDALQMVSYVIT